MAHQPNQFITTDTVALFDRTGEAYSIQLNDIELIRSSNSRTVQQVIAHLALTAPEHTEKAKEVLSAPFLQMWYKPDLQKQGIDYTGKTGRAFVKLLLVDRYQPPEIRNNIKHLSALIAVSQFRFIGEDIDYLSNPHNEAKPEDFAIQLSTRQPQLPGRGLDYATQYLGVHTEKITSGFKSVISGTV